MITVCINSENRQIPAAISVSELLELLELRGQRLAVELNHEIVPRSQHAETLLRDGDNIEIVRAIGGG